VKPLLSVRNLCVDIHRGRKHSRPVNNISFDLGFGEICGIVGESGCGKTLSSLSIAGLLPPVAKANGSILFNNSQSENSESIDLLSLNEEEYCSVRGREISMIFQEPFSSLNPLQRIGDQVTETLVIHKGKKDNKQYRLMAIELMEKLGFQNPEKVLDTYPFRLSGGMCQRVMIALAMICSPKLLIADEPTTALDTSTQEQILLLLREINKTGVSVLFISHDLGVIKSICTRVMVMYAGSIVEEGNADEVFTNPAHEYTRLLLAALPERAKKGERLRIIPGYLSMDTARPESHPFACPFAPRCVKSTEKCLSALSQEFIINENHKHRCTGGA
jgi:peptide/nickel transport system ATP-binding protein